MNISYQLIKSAKRKTIGLQIKNGEVFVRAPYYITRPEIDQLIINKKSWILAKVNEQLTKPQLTPESCFTAGDGIWYLGSRLTLNIAYCDKSASSVDINENNLTLYLNYRYQRQDIEQQKLTVKKHLESFYKAQCELYLQQKLPVFIAQTGLIPSEYKVRRYKARWGSCNSKKALSFNYLLMMVPRFVFDYVIIHELCHLKHLNHSAHFWQLVAKYCPKYQQAKAWLKEYQGQLHWL